MSVVGIDAGELWRAVAVELEGEGRAAHEIASLRTAAERLSGLFSSHRARGPCHLPASTLDRDDAQRLGIRDANDLWGGVVPTPFVATKLVSHPLFPGETQAPDEWLAIAGIDACTLPGYSVFSRQAFLAAAMSLLAHGAIRVKSPHDRGGHGQWVVRDEVELQAWLDAVRPADLATGMVVESNLDRAVAHSVGCSVVAGRQLAYHGKQRNVSDCDGRIVYGGSRLRIMRGSLQAMHAAMEEGEERMAVGLALMYDDAVRSAYGVIASRCNYDVVSGRDADGHARLGVLEQSWRFGGASMAEVLAFEYFERYPDRDWVTAETVEGYDLAEPIPRGAVLHWPGGNGAPRKYARIIADGY